MAWPTNPIYKLVQTDSSQTGKSAEVYAVKTELNNRTTFIPFSEENKEYQKYLDWVAEGGVAEAAD